MADLVALLLSLIIVLIVMLRRTSSGMAILAVLAGVMLDQLLTKWLIGLLPNAIFDSSPYITVAIRSFITLAPVVVVLFTVRVSRQNAVLSLLTALLLGFLVFSFSIEILELLPQLAEHTKNSGLLHFLDPYKNTILAGSAILALVDMSLSHSKPSSKEKKTKKNKH